MNGEVVGSYRITGTLGVGGMGSIYKAEHTLIGRKAAVKMLLPEFSRNREVVTRFFNEARATAAIRHPGIVEIFDFGYHASGQAYLVMELLAGEPLSARLERDGAMAEPIASAILRSVLGALAAAHALGIVHRDLKPDNIFLVPDPDVPGGERPKLLDFGIAKLADTAAGGSATRSGIVMGTPRYMAPEQCRGSGAVDARADLYAIGCIYYEMLTGRVPFMQEGSGELIAAHLMIAPDSPRTWTPTISELAEAVILRLLAKSPDARFASANELLGALGGATTPEGARATARTVALPTPSGLAAPSVPTTLSSAVGRTPSSPAIRRGRGWGLAALATVVLGAAGLIGWRTIASDDDPAPIAPAAHPAPPAVERPSPPPPVIAHEIAQPAPAPVDAGAIPTSPPPDAPTPAPVRPTHPPRMHVAPRAPTPAPTPAPARSTTPSLPPELD